MCDCGGIEHPVYTNCIGCGRLLCVKEGEGPCFHCGVHVTSSDNLPPEIRDSEEYKYGLYLSLSITQINNVAVKLKDALLKADSEYLSDNLKVHDLHAGWFEEAHDIYNARREEAHANWIKEEKENAIEASKYFCM